MGISSKVSLRAPTALHFKVGCDLHTGFNFSLFNVDLSTECGKKSVFIQHRIQVYVFVLELVPTTIPH